GLLGSEERLQLWVNVAIKIPKVFPAMSNHRSRESGHRFRRDLNRTGDEELVVWKHEENVQRSTRLRKRYGAGGAQRPIPNAAKRCRCYASALMKLMSPLRSTRAIFIFERSSVLAVRRISSSTSCSETWFRRM